MNCAERREVLERQVADLLLLTRHQAATVQSLQQESYRKSERILELQRAAGKAAISADSGHVLRPKMRVASEVAAQPTKGRGILFGPKTTICPFSSRK